MAALTDAVKKNIKRKIPIQLKNLNFIYNSPPKGFFKSLSKQLLCQVMLIELF